MRLRHNKRATDGALDSDALKVRNRLELRNVIAMSIPIVITTSSRAVMDCVDLVMIRALKDTNALAAMLPSQMMFWMIICFGMGTVTIVSTFASQNYGRKEYAACSAYTWQAIYMTAGFSLLVMVFSPWLPILLDVVGHEQGIRVHEFAYTRVIIWSVFPTIAANALSSFFNGVHKPRITMWTMLEAQVVNVVVSAPLIYGWFGLPRLEIAGAAWGTLAGVSYRAMRLGWVMLSSKYDGQFATRSTWKFDAGRFKQVLRVGSSVGLQWLNDLFVWGLFVLVLIGRYFDGFHLAATGVAWNYMRFSFMPAHGVGIALSAIVGKAIGEGDATRAERMTRISVLIMLAYMGTLSILYFIFRVPMIAWFNEEPAVVAIGSSVILCTAVFQLFDALMIGYIYALRGAGDTAWPAWFSCISHWIFIAGGGFLMVTFAPQLGSIGPWMAATALIMFIGVAVRFRWKSGVWKTVDLFERGDQPATAKPATDCADTVNVKATSNEILVSAEYAEDFGTFSRLDT